MPLLEQTAGTDIPELEPVRKPRNITPLKRRILTAVPIQLHEEKGKLEWLDRVADEHKPHIIVAPQEFFGGVVAMPHHPFYREEEILPQLLDFTRLRGIGLVTGVVESEGGCNRERLWFIDNGELKGKITKFALPRYSRKGSHGSYDTIEEMSLKARAVTFPIQGLNVAGVFCWETFSDIWHELAYTEPAPDLICHCVKFGPSAFPGGYHKREDGKVYADLKKFGYMPFKTLQEDPWFERLRMASTYEVCCPIATSCNSWGLRGRSHAFDGAIFEVDAVNTVWSSSNEDKVIPEHVGLWEYDFNRVRAAQRTKWDWYELCDCNPPKRWHELTMLWKMRRIARKRRQYDRSAQLEAFA